MKKSLIFLFAAALFAFTSPATQAQDPTFISSSDASFLLQKTIGKWQVNMSTFAHGSKGLTKYSGKATYNPSLSDIAVHEQSEIYLADGTTQAEEGSLRYSKVRHQFEFVKEDPSTGKEVILYTGNWYADFKTILLTAVPYSNSKKDKKVQPDQMRYVFMDNGSFIKMIHRSDKDGNMVLTNQYQYLPATTAEL